jgi:Lon protease-like protein
MNSEIIYDVPIFPLHSVLFPSLPLHLHIFEERYRTMLRDLRSRDNRFCVALIEEGEEVGDYAVPAQVACLAEIVELQPLPDGRYFVVAVGVERAKILSTDRSTHPYLTGSLEIWPDESAGVSPELIGKASSLFEQYIDHIMKLVGKENERVSTPGEPDLLSYVLATALQTDAAVRQKLLEIPGSEQRLRTEVQMLQTELPLLRSLAAIRETPSAGYRKFSAN